LEWKVATSGVDYHAPMRLPRLFDASLYSICLVVLLAALADLAWLHRLAPVDASLSDALIRLRAASRTPDPSIVVVDIDDRSLGVMADRVGRFPWPRSVYGEVLLEMQRQGAAAVVMDVELYEPDVIRPEQDLVLNEASRAALTRSSDPPAGTRRRQSVGSGSCGGAESARCLGDPNARPDAAASSPSIGVSRTGLINYVRTRMAGRRWLPGKSAAGGPRPARRAALGYPPPGRLIRLDFGGQWPAPAVPRLRRSRCLAQRPRTSSRRIAVLGCRRITCAIFAPPRRHLLPGRDPRHRDRQSEERRALRDGRRPHRSVALRAAPGAAAALNPLQTCVLVGAALALLGGAWFALGRSLLLPVAAPLVFAWLFFFLAALRAYLKEQRAKEQRERVLSRFLDPRLVKSLVAEGVKLEDIKSETRTITVLFSDIRGFTSLSESRPAEEVVAMLNRYLSMQTERVFHTAARSTSSSAMPSWPSGTRPRTTRNTPSTPSPVRSTWWQRWRDSTRATPNQASSWTLALGCTRAPRSSVSWARNANSNTPRSGTQ
jgi:adenylate cyclase